MLSSILAKSDCAACKFCCSFRHTSLWETPIFPAADLPKLQALNPDAKFRPAGSGTENAGNSSITSNQPASPSSCTFDLTTAYHTTNPEEEAPCPFLDPNSGCMLPQDLKPFECKIWPLRAVRRQDNSLAVALTPTCPAINRQPLDLVRNLAASGLGQQILDYAADHPDIIKEITPFLSNIVFPASY